jgi:hypothetical protein
VSGELERAGTGDWDWVRLVGWAGGGLQRCSSASVLHVQAFVSVVRWRRWNSTGRAGLAPMPLTTHTPRSLPSSDCRTEQCDASASCLSIVLAFGLVWATLGNARQTVVDCGCDCAGAAMDATALACRPP